MKNLMKANSYLSNMAQRVFWPWAALVAVMMFASTNAATSSADDSISSVIQVIGENVRGALPELAFDELRTKDQVATATIELQLLELVLKIKRVRPNYDDALITALQMAGKAGASMGLREIAVLDNESLAFDNDRPILPVNRLDQIRLAEAELSLAAQMTLMGGEGRRWDTNETADSGGEEEMIADA